MVFQPDFDDPRYSGINPYALGFAMMQDIERICTDPTAEDQQWFPAHRRLQRPRWRCCATCGRTTATRASSCSILSPRMIRQFGLFHVLDDANEPQPAGPGDPRRARLSQDPAALARALRCGLELAPDIQVVDVNLAGDRRLILHHRALNRVLLEEKDAKLVLQHLADLWGYDVLLKEIDPATDAVLKEHAATPRAGIVQLG